MNTIEIKIGRKKCINYLLDIFLTSTIIITLISSYILWFVLPRGIGLHGVSYCKLEGEGISGNYFTVLDLPRYIWIELHNWASVSLLLLVLFHIIIHWNWIIEITNRFRRNISTFNKIAEQYIVVVLIYIFFIFNCFSGFVIWLILPRGAEDFENMVANTGRTFWGLQRNVWCDIHVWISIALLSIIIIHILCNWRFIVSISKIYLSELQNSLLKKY